MTAHDPYMHRPLGSVLILEDEALVSMLMEDLLLRLGADAVHVCGNPLDALAVIEQGPVDCAVLDVRVGGETSYAVADLLDSRGIPFLFSTASAVDGIEERHRNRPLLTKPFADADLERALIELNASAG